jgi:hypothetical protein
MPDWWVVLAFITGAVAELLRQRFAAPLRRAGTRTARWIAPTFHHEQQPDGTVRPVLDHPEWLNPGGGDSDA